MDSASSMVCVWLPDNGWARRRVWSALRFWLWERPECAGRQELFLVHRSAGSCRLLFCWRIPFLSTVPGICGSRVMRIWRKISITLIIPAYQWINLSHEHCGGEEVPTHKNHLAKSPWPTASQPAKSRWEGAPSFVACRERTNYQRMGQPPITCSLLGEHLERLRIDDGTIHTRQSTAIQFQPHECFPGSKRICQPGDERVGETEARIVVDVANHNHGPRVSLSARLYSTLDQHGAYSPTLM